MAPLSSSIAPLHVALNKFIEPGEQSSPGGVHHESAVLLRPDDLHSTGLGWGFGVKRYVTTAHTQRVRTFSVQPPKLTTCVVPSE